MPTPVKDTSKTPTTRKKAINYRGTPVTKNLFCTNEKTNKNTLTAKKGKTSVLKDPFTQSVYTTSSWPLPN